MPIFASRMRALILLFLALASQLAHAQATEALTKADSLFAQGKFNEALAAYEGLVNTQRMASPRMLYRMALAEENKGHVPRTLYYLSLLYNLRQDESVRARIESLARQNELQGYDFDEWDFSRSLLRNYSAWLFAGFTVVVAILILLLRRRRRQGRQLQLLPLAIVLLLGAAALVLNLDVRYGKAIVQQPKAPLMNAPSAAGTLQASLPAGTRLTVIGEEDVWLRVVYNGRQGYVNRYAAWYL